MRQCVCARTHINTLAHAHSHTATHSQNTHQAAAAVEIARGDAVRACLIEGAAEVHQARLGDADDRRAAPLTKILKSQCPSTYTIEISPYRALFRNFAASAGGRYRTDRTSFCEGQAATIGGAEGSAPTMAAAAADWAHARTHTHTL